MRGRTDDGGTGRLDGDPIDSTLIRHSIVIREAINNHKQGNHKDDPHATAYHKGLPGDRQIRQSSKDLVEKMF